MQELERPTFHIVRSREEVSASTSEGADARVFVIEESLGYLVNYLAKLFAQIQTTCLAPHEVFLGQWGVLLFLWAQDGQSQRELSRHVAIDDASMVRNIDRMERDGLVHRVRNAHDRRQINIYLTEKGRGLRDTLIPCALAGNAAATQSLTEAEQSQLSTLLRQMIVSLEQALSIQSERT